MKNLIITARELHGYCKFCGELNTGYNNIILIPSKKETVRLCDHCRDRLKKAISDSPENEDTILNSIL